MKILLKLSVAIFPLLHFVGEWWKGFSITGSANPTITQSKHKVILSCEVKGCTSSNLSIHLYKWESSKNQTLFMHNSTRPDKIQEKYPRERNKNDSLRGEYKNGFLFVALEQVEVMHSGQYVCAGMCDDVYDEYKMQLQIEGKINSSIGEVAVFSFQPFETYKLSHLKLLWTKIDSGKRQKIYSYLYQEACPSICSKYILGDRCSSSHGPIIQEWFAKNYEQRTVISKAQMLMRNIFLFKVSNIQTEDAGKYRFSVESQELRKMVIFTLSVTGFSITGSANPTITQSKHKVILSCEMKGCTSSNLWIHLYKWESSKNQTLFIHNSKRQHNIQEKYPRERDKNDSPKGEYKNGLLSVALEQVELMHSGHYVCAAMCNDVYKESKMELQVEGSWFPPDFLWVLLVLMIFVLVLIIITVQCCCKHKDPLRTENDQLRAENCKFKEELEQLKPLKEFCDVCFYRVDVIFDSKKAHPRLKVLETGKSVIDTGNISMILNSEDIPNHMGILATQGYSNGKYYWEVDVSQKNKWHLGVVSESICRKGKITFSPQNGYWVIGPGDKTDYYAWTDPWTFLNVTRKLTRIGIFLDILADKHLSFYDIHSKKKLYTFTINCSKKLYPFFSLGTISVQEYNLPVRIV